jgi:solute carrier family 25 citrate transporter 1
LLESVFGKGNKAQINLWSGLLAGAVEAAIWTQPTERIKILRQTEIGGGNRYGNIFSATKYIVQTQGIQGMFVGLVPTSLRQASSVGIRMALYPFVKELFPSDGGTLTHMLSGGIVGGLSVIINNPIDVIKSIQQAGKLNAQGKKMGTIECGQHVYKESGITGFGRGLTARVPRVFCGQAITFAVYEQMADLLSRI